MVKLYQSGVFLVNGSEICEDETSAKQALMKHCDEEKDCTREECEKGTIAYQILSAHNKSGDMQNLRMKFDSLTSHDITYVGIIQTARASGMKHFPVPYVLTNCHNSLCAVGGTINEDDHQFALSAAHKYGGIYVPANLAVIHTYNREMMSGCGRMILGSDSHTRYGALGTMAVGEGGGELVKQLLGRTYDLPKPEVIGIYLDGHIRDGIGPQDVALAIIGAVYKCGYVKNKVMEFVGPGVASLPMDFRNGIDVMTTETTCWSSIWVTDEKTREYFEIHHRPEAYNKLSPKNVAYYDGMVYVDLSTVESMIALPMHPSYTCTIHQLQENPGEILKECEERINSQITGASISMMKKIHSDGVYVDQGLVAGCSGGTFDNVCAVADILRGKSCGNGQFRMSVYPDSMPSYLELMRNGALADIVSAGAVIRECFCGPCFGAGDTPANGEFSIRHTTRNFPNREGSKPGEGQMSAVALMDARSIAATAVNGGRLTAATDIDVEYTHRPYTFDSSVYDKRIYFGFGKPEEDYELVMGPNIKPWPEMREMTRDLLLKVVSHITDPVTTTDELIPSGETSSFRSNPMRLAEFALSRKDPDYVPNAKKVQVAEKIRVAGEKLPEEICRVYDALAPFASCDPENTNIGSTIFAIKPGDGSAREQAASCQRVLGACANIVREFATKRYRSNCINWGMMPFTTKDEDSISLGDYVFVPDVREKLLSKDDDFVAFVVHSDFKVDKIHLSCGNMTDDERQILADGCLINFYKKSNK